MTRRLLRTALVLAFLFVTGSARAHDIPADVRIQAILKPTEKTLQLIVRAPLKAMLDVNFPKLESGRLDLDRANPALRTAAELWIVGNVEIFENGSRLAELRIADVHASIESDPSFASYESARAHIAAPQTPTDAAVHWDQAMLDVRLEYRIHSDRSEFAIEPHFARLGLNVQTALRFSTPDGPDRVFVFGGNPGKIVLDPRWHHAITRFVADGVRHILGGADHLLFLFCLVIPFRRFRPLLIVVTAFTAAHSVTLAAAVFGIMPGALWFPPLVETAIAASILYMAIENIVKRNVERRWVMAFGFGLAHGFGFAFALRQTLQFAGSHLGLAVAAFNLGVELGQILALAAMAPLLHRLFDRVVDEKIGVIILSAFAAHTAWHWLMDRGAILLQYHFNPEAWPPADIAAVLRVLIVLLLACGLIRVFNARTSRLR